MYVLYVYLCVTLCVCVHTYVLHYFPLIATRPCHHRRLPNIEPCSKHKEERGRMKRQSCWQRKQDTVGPGGWSQMPSTASGDLGSFESSLVEPGLILGTWPEKRSLLIPSCVSEGHLSFNTILNKNYLVGENLEFLSSL